MEVSLIENLVREDLTPVAKAEALKKLQGEKKYEQKDLATMFGKSQSTISEILSLSNLPATIKNECIGDHKYALRRLKRIAAQKNPQKMQKMFDDYKKQFNKTVEDRKTGTRNSTQVEKKRLGRTKERLLKVRDKWSKKNVEGIKDELLELRSLIDEILGREE